MGDVVIRTEGLTKRFGQVLALDGLDLEVRRGEIFGFLGPNGAGKSTTIRLLLSLLRPTSGSAWILGIPVCDVGVVHRHVGYVPGDVALWPQLTGEEILTYLGNLSGRVDRPFRDELLERLKLDPSVRARSYSKGNRQKVALVAALMHRPDVLLLDEPTSGLDPLMEEVFRECVADLRGRGRTVLLSSHILAEAEALADRVSIIRKGRTVETGSLDQLRHLTRTAVSAELAADPDGAAAELRALTGVHEVSVQARDGHPQVRFEVEPGGLDGALQVLTRSGVRGLVSRPPTLEELFLRHYADDLAATGNGRANGDGASR